MSTFQPITVYDKPGIAINMILDGEGNFETFKKLALAPEELTPDERSTLGDRIAAITGENPLMKAAVGVLTNPFTWLAFITSPVGGNVMAHAGELFTAKILKTWISKNPGVLQVLGLTGMDSAITPAGSMVGRTSVREFEKLSNIVYNDYQPGAQKLLEHLQAKFPTMKITSLNPEAHAGEARELLTDLMTGLRNKNLQAGKRVAELENVYHEVKTGFQFENILDEAGNATGEVRVRKLGDIGEPVQLKPTRQEQVNIQDWYKLNDAEVDVTTYNLESFIKRFLKGDLATITADEANQIKQKLVAKPEGWIFNRTVRSRRVLRDGMVKYDGTPFKSVRPILGEGKGFIESGITDSLARIAPKDLTDEFERGWQVSGRRSVGAMLGDADHADLERWIAEGTGRMPADRAKVDKLVYMVTETPSVLRREGMSPDAVQGMEFLYGLLDEDQMAKVARGEMKADELRQEILNLFDNTERGGTYVPVFQDTPLRVGNADLKTAHSLQEAAYLKTTRMDRFTPQRGDSVLFQMDDIDRMQRLGHIDEGTANMLRESTQSAIEEVMNDVTKTAPLALNMNYHQVMVTSTTNNVRTASHVTRPITQLEVSSINQTMKELQAVPDRSPQGVSFRNPGMQEWVEAPKSPQYQEYLNKNPNKLPKTMVLEDPLGTGQRVVVDRATRNSADLTGPRPRSKALNEQEFVAAFNRQDEVGKRFRRSLSPVDFYESNYKMLQNVGNDWAAAKYRNSWMDVTMGRGGVDLAIAKGQVYEAKGVLAGISKSTLGKKIRESGEWGRGFMNKIDMLAEPRNVVYGGSGFTHDVARWLYTSHLGLNPASMAVNLLQPFMLAGNAGGYQHLIPAYVDALKEQFSYWKDRVNRYGFRSLEGFEQEGLILKHFSMAGATKNVAQGLEEGVTRGFDVIRINPQSAMGLVDAIGSAGVDAGKRTFMDKVQDSFMMGFQQTEWLNRNVTAHMVKRMYQGNGLNPFSPQNLTKFVTDASEAVNKFQFAADKFGSPTLFHSSNLFGDPVIRQFLAFPMKSLVSAVWDLPRMHESSYFKGLMSTTLRGMGVSAIAYELGKNALGVDLSKGLYSDAATSLVTGNSALFEKSEGNPFPLPPALDISVGMVRGVAQGDRALLQSSISRLVPGGIHLGKMLGVAPELPGDGLLQKTYADYNAALPDGRVPLYKADGTLIDYRTPGQLLMRAVGVDLGNFNAGSELDNYFVKQREEILKYKQKYLQAVADGDTQKAQAVSQEFSKRFKDPTTKQGIPLTVTRAQLEGFVKQRTTPRPERILDRLPPEVRGMYTPLAQANANRFNVPSEALASGTANSRNDQRAGYQQMSQEARARFDKEQGLPGSGRDRSSFGGFGEFGDFSAQ